MLGPNSSKTSAEHKKYKLAMSHNSKEIPILPVLARIADGTMNIPDPMVRFTSRQNL